MAEVVAGVAGGSEFTETVEVVEVVLEVELEILTPIASVSQGGSSRLPASTIFARGASAAIRSAIVFANA